MGESQAMNEVVTPEVLDKYEALTTKALQKAKTAPPERSHLRPVAEDFRAMAQAYVDDARHFRSKGDLVRAFGALNYAHAWLDAGARLGLFDVDGDDQLFTLAD
jgi:uncharacterized protein